MSNRELEVIMTLKDQVTKRLQGIQGAFNKLTSIAREVGELGIKFERLGRNVMFLSAAVTGPFVLALRSASQYSIPIKNQMESLSAIFTIFQLQIAQAVTPVVQRFVNILGGLYNAFLSLSPSTRDAAVQGVFLTGIYGGLAGIIFTLAGRVMKLATQISGLSIAMAALSPIQRILLAIIGSLVVMITFWDQLKGVAVPVLNLLESGLSLVAALANQLCTVFWTLGAAITKIFEGLFFLLSKIPGPTKQLFEDLKTGAAALSDTVGNQLNYSLESTSLAFDQIFKTWKAGEGLLSTGMEDISAKVKEVWNLVNNPPPFNAEAIKAQLKNAKDAVQREFSAIKEIVSGVSQAMAQSMGDFFYNALTGQLKSAKEMFADFGKSVLRILSDVIAKLIVMRILQAAAGPSGSLAGVAVSQLFHQGGIVEKMHRGGPIRAHEGMSLASDEVPIIAQTGEGVLSRKGMAALTKDTFDRLNRGESRGGESRGGKPRGGGGVSINIYPFIHLWGARDIAAQKDTIKAIISEAITTNSSLRRLLKYDL